MTAKPTKKDVQTATFHATDGEKHVVGVKALHVMLLQDGHGWFAQGIEIDYAAGGQTVDEAKKNFGEGLARTIKEHLAMYGKIDKLLTPAPPELWKEFYESPPSAQAAYSTINAYEILKRVADRTPAEIPFPFGVIRFIKASSVTT